MIGEETNSLYNVRETRSAPENSDSIGSLVQRSVGVSGWVGR